MSSHSHFEVLIRLIHPIRPGFDDDLRDSSLQLIREWEQGDAKPLGGLEQTSGALFFVAASDAPSELAGLLSQTLIAEQDRLERPKDTRAEWTCEMVAYLNPCEIIAGSIDVSSDVLARISLLGGAISFAFYICDGS